VAAGAPARLALRGAWNTALLLSVQALLLHAVLAGRARAEQRWRRLFEGNLQPLWVADAEGRVVLVNDAAVRQYGHSRESFAALTVGDLVAAPPDGAPRVGTWHRRADGTLLEIEMTTQPLPGDETLTYATDVTERNALRRALADASSTERRRLAHDVHDGLGQELTALSMFARSLVTRVRREAPAGALALEEIAETIERTARGALESCRRIARGLSPIDSAGGRLHDALEALARGASLPDGTAVTYTGDLANADLPPEDADHLYRIAQEALANAQRHAGAIEIRLVAARNGDELRLAIEDDGAGLSAAARSRPGLGLRTMRSRAAQIGAAFAIEPRDGGGTRVLVRYPLEARG
jgi:signal transduction histidine kinase